MTDNTTLAGMPLDEWMRRYSEHPFEMVNGEVILIHPPGRHHSMLSKAIYDAISRYLDEHPLGVVFHDNTPYMLDGDDRTDWVSGTVIPDVSFIIQSRLDDHEALYLDDGPWCLAPDLPVEGVSPHDKHSALMRKVADYLHYGTQQVWVVDPQNRTIRVHTATNPDGTTLHAGDTLRGDPLLPDFALSVTAILGKP